MRCHYSVWSDTVWSQMITSSSCYVETFYFQFGYFLLWPFCNKKNSFFRPGFSVCWLVFQYNPLKAQLENRGFSYHSSCMNVLIIRCGHTVDVITIHSELSWRDDSRLQTPGLGGWTLRFYSQLCTETSCRWTGCFWTLHWLQLSSSWACCHVERARTGFEVSVCLFYKNTIPPPLSNKQNLSLPKPEQFFWNLMKEHTFPTSVNTAFCICSLMGAMLW